MGNTHAEHKSNIDGNIISNGQRNGTILALLIRSRLHTIVSEQHSKGDLLLDCVNQSFWGRGLKIVASLPTRNGDNAIDNCYKSVKSVSTNLQIRSKKKTNQTTIVWY
jgi:hypothetical protein